MSPYHLSGKPVLYGRLWFQSLAGLAICVGVPLLVRIMTTGRPLATTEANAAIGAGIAFLMSLYAFRQMATFPGLRATTNILSSLGVSFAVVAVAFLFFRFEYSRSIFLVSAGLSLFWLAVIYLVFRRFIKPRYAVVPGGNADKLLAIKGINWQVLEEPPKIYRKLGAIAADLRADHNADWQRFLADAALAGIPVYHSKILSETLTGMVEIEHMSENSFGSLLPNSSYVTFKSIVDWLMALLLLPIFALVCAIVAIVIALIDGWPVHFTQERVGHRGRPYQMIKFRTMRPQKLTQTVNDADSPDTAVQEGETRVTGLGRVLRRYRLDELPQIINILKGEMSWIGPRPERVPLVEWYERELPFYSYRHIIKPGISGWAQVNIGHGTAPEMTLRKLHYDFYYIKYLSPWLDLLIVLRTFRTIKKGFGAR